MLPNREQSGHQNKRNNILNKSLIDGKNRHKQYENCLYKLKD